MACGLRLVACATCGFHGLWPAACVTCGLHALSLALPAVCVACGLCRLQLLSLAACVAVAVACIACIFRSLRPICTRTRKEREKKRQRLAWGRPALNKYFACVSVHRYVILPALFSLTYRIASQPEYTLPIARPVIPTASPKIAINSTNNPANCMHSEEYHSLAFSLQEPQIRARRNLCVLCCSLFNCLFTLPTAHFFFPCI